MNSLEKRATLSLASIFSFRMIGLFMVLPIFSLYATHFQHATPFLIGLAIGIYGLTQGIMQIPFGTLSDKYPRKIIITIGLLLFISGSIIAASTTSIYIVILGRALQGSGAIGSVLIALLTDLIPEEQRSIAMAIMGIMIGVSFLFAMILGPILGNWIQLRGLFLLTAALGLLSIFLLYFTVPTPQRFTSETNTAPFRTRIFELINHKDLLILDFGIFCLHVILTACFVSIPLIINRYLSLHHTWILYASVLMSSSLITFPLLRIAERKQLVHLFFNSAIIILTASLLWLWHFSFSLGGMAIGLFLFFLAFNFLEANLPSLVSRLAPSALKGTAIGIYSSAQFLGIFCGGVLGGWLYGITQPETIFFVCGIIAMLWFLSAKSMSNIVASKASYVKE